MQRYGSAACSLNSVQRATCAARSRAQCVTRHGGARACVGRRKSAATLLSAYADALGRHSVLPPARTQYTLEYSRVPDASQSTKRHRPVARVAFALGCANCARERARPHARVLMCVSACVRACVRACVNGCARCACIGSIPPRCFASSPPWRPRHHQRRRARQVATAAGRHRRCSRRRTTCDAAAHSLPRARAVVRGGGRCSRRGHRGRRGRPRRGGRARVCWIERAVGRGGAGAEIGNRI